MSMFDLNSVAEKSNSGNADLYIYPGVKRVVIEEWSKGESAQGTPAIKVKLITKAAKDAGKDDASKEFSFYMSEKAQEMSLRKVKHIVTKVTKEENIKPASNADQFVAMLNSLTKGKELRVKFVGREYLNSNGEVKEAAEIGLPDFAEAVIDGAEYPVVSDEDTKLTYDKNNQYDFRKLPADQTPESQVGSASNAPAW